MDIIADGIEINIENGKWRLFNTTGAHSLTPFFETVRGEGLLRYTPGWAEPRGLPGNVLSIQYVRAVVVGLEKRNNRWTIGLHVALREDEPARFVELAHWPPEDLPEHAQASHTAGRVLAEFLTCPLKLFGVRKSAQQPGVSHPTVTGPLAPHKREDVDLRDVQSLVKEINLPLTLGEIWLGQSNPHTLVLRLPKQTADKSKGEVPAYQNATFDRASQTVRLLPPTGLLGVVFGPRGRIVNYTDIRNVEYRHTLTHESTLKPEGGEMATDVTRSVHRHEVFLTLSDESVLILQIVHETSSELQRRRLTMKREGIEDIGQARQDMEYLRQHQRDQAYSERSRRFADRAALVIASNLSRNLVRTQVGDFIE